MPEANGSYTTDTQRLDMGAFYSAVLGFGNVNKDKMETFRVGARRRLTGMELWELYETNNFIANVIDAVPDAATQKWCIYESDREDDSIQKELEKVKPYINQAWKLARLQGWAAVVMLLNDGVTDYSQPAEERRIRGISGYNALAGGEAGEIAVQKYDENPMSPTYGQPQVFTISAQPVHASRLLLFYGVKRLSRLRGQLGTSVLDRCHQEFRNFDVGNNAIAATLPDFNLDIFEVPGLAPMLAKQKDFAEFIQGIAFARSVLKVMMVEAGNNGSQGAGGYKIISRPYTGVKELLEYYKQLFAGATDLPDTMLYGESPDGQTSGKYEMRSWAQYIANQQQSVLHSELDKLINYLHLTTGTIPKDWSLEFPSILELDESEQADVELKRAQRLGLLVDRQIVTAEEAAHSLADHIDVAKAIDFAAREEEMRSLESFPEGIAQLPHVIEEAEEEDINNVP